MTTSQNAQRLQTKCSQANLRCADDTAFVTDEPQHLNGASPEVGHAFLQSVSLMCHKGYTGQSFQLAMGLDQD